MCFRTLRSVSGAIRCDGVSLFSGRKVPVHMVLRRGVMDTSTVPGKHCRLVPLRTEMVRTAA